MKEQSIEEKAKRYDKALERAKDNYNAADSANINVNSFKNTLIDIFPELAESDDERTRKELTEFLKSASGGFLDTTIQCKTFGKWITWLEKQYEKDNFIEKELQCIKGYRENAIKKLEELKKQGEKKPVDKVEPKFHEGDWVTIKE